MFLAITRVNGQAVELQTTIGDLLQVAQPDDFLEADASKLADQLRGRAPIAGQLMRTVKPQHAGRHAAGRPPGPHIELQGPDLALPALVLKELQKANQAAVVFVLLGSLMARRIL